MDKISAAPDTRWKKSTINYSVCLCHLHKNVHEFLFHIFSLSLVQLTFYSCSQAQIWAMTIVLTDGAH